ncbi:MCE family protein [Nocardia mikamii]|uniref:MCE family protein n=1 Tax=Nocardia mikamii TaxID=508464 RepID=UPI0007A3A7EC|nr:MlaD family protein [Nocardia mikamii]
MHKTRLVKLQLTVFAVVAAVSLVFVGINYCGIQNATRIGTYTVTAHFADGAGLYDNALVTYRGSDVGVVRSISLSDNGIAVQLQLKSNKRIPADTPAAIKSVSAVGEQYVDLTPTADRGPYLHDGSVIPLEHTTIPTSAATLLDHVDRLLQVVPPEDLRQTLAEGSRALDAQGSPAGRLIDSADSIIALAQKNWDPTKRLIQDAEPLLDAGNAVSSDLTSSVHDLASFTAQLAGDDPNVRTVLDQGKGFADTVGSALTDLTAPLPNLLANLQTVGQVLRVNVPGLRQILVVYPAITASFNYSVQHQGLQRDGDQLSAQAPLDVKLLNTFGPVTCTQGYESTQRRDPSDTSPAPANPDATCMLPHNDPQAVRGSRNMPCVSNPAVRTTYQADCPGGAPSTWPGMLSHPGGAPASAPAGPPPPTPTAVPSPAGPAEPAPPAAPIAQPTDAPAAVPYDPVTGRFTAPDGKAYTVSSFDTTQKEAMTWQQLLIKPTRN